MRDEKSSSGDAVIVSNRDAPSPFVIFCDHASRHVPERYGNLGLTEAELDSHIAWDPGALAVAECLSNILNAPLVRSTVSRLIIDCNRALDAENLIWTMSEATRIAANECLDEAERQHRIDRFYRPYHQACSDLLDRRREARQETILVCIHSFTPIYNGVSRPWPIGLIHGKNDDYARRVLHAMKAAAPGMEIGWNEPYGAKDGVTFTLERHGVERGLAVVMIEIRNSELLEAAGAGVWAERIARCLEVARQGRLGSLGS